jgi:hypothetical protein
MNTRMRSFPYRLANQDASVVAWRRDQLRAAGFAERLAEQAAV